MHFVQPAEQLRPGCGRVRGGFGRCGPTFAQARLLRVQALRAVGGPSAAPCPDRRRAWRPPGRTGSRTLPRVECAASDGACTGNDDHHAVARWAAPRLAELWEYRELLYFLIWRDVKVRYKQTAARRGWAVIQPVCRRWSSSALFFGGLADVPSRRRAVSGVRLRRARCPGRSSRTRVTAGQRTASSATQHLITKVYFPRLIVPAGGGAGRPASTSRSRFVAAGS